MAKYPTIRAGQRATATLLDSMLPDVIVKTTTEGVSASTTMQNDDTLFAAAEANATYQVHLFLLHDSPTAADLKLGWSGPSGATMDWGIHGAGTGSTSSATVPDTNMQTRTISETATIGGGASTGTTAIVMGTLTTSSTAGTLNFQFAQGTSDATASNVRAGSTLTVRRTA